MKKRIELICRSAVSGILIGLGCAAILSTNLIFGSLLFCFALVLICQLQLPLYTGQIGNFFSFSRKEKEGLMFIWIGNFLGILIISILCSLGNYSIREKAISWVAQRSAIDSSMFLLRSIACGTIMHVIVTNYKTSENQFGRIAGLILGVMLFINCGFEHTIADMGYTMMGFSFNRFWDVINIITLSTIGNSLGAIGVNALKFAKK